MDAAVERDELFLRLGFGEESTGEPENSGDCGGEERRFGSDDGTVAGEFHVGENEGKNGGADGGDDFAPGVDAPPIPAKDEHCAGAGTDAEDDRPPVEIETSWLETHPLARTSTTVKSLLMLT